MSWNEWKINFPIFRFRVIVDFVLKIHRKINQSWVQKQRYLKNLKSEKLFVIRFSTYRIFHVIMTTFEILKFFLSNYFLSIWLKKQKKIVRGCAHGPRMHLDWDPRLTINIEYKIDYISKTKSRTKNNLWTRKSISQHYASIDTTTFFYHIYHKVPSSLLNTVE